MGFFKDFKEDLSQAVDELASDTISGSMSDDSIGSKFIESEADVIQSETLKNMAREMDLDDENEEKALDKTLSNVEKKENAKGNNKNNRKSVQTAQKEEPVEPEEYDDEEEMTDDGAVAEETALITKGLTITGDMNSRGSIDILGIVEGNVACRGKLTISGEVIGNTKSMEIFANNARIDGNIESSGSVKIGQGTVVIGNIVATSAVIAGAVKGDIDVHGPVIVDESAVVVGDIKSRTVQINNGATIDGRCSQCYSDANLEDIFNKRFGKKNMQK